MSLNAQLAAFKKEQANVAARNIAHSRPTAPAPARSSTPKPAPTAAASTETAKRTHADAFSGGAAGTEILAQTNQALNKLKEIFPASKSFDDIISYLSLPNDAKKNIPRIKSALKTHVQSEWIPATATSPDMFKFRPKYPISNGEELKDFLAQRTSAQGIPVKDLKECWPDCVNIIDQLEKEHFILVVRNKKDQTPKLVYPDSPSYHLSVDTEFRDFWFKTKVPTTDVEIRNELEKAGQTPTSQVKEVIKGNMKKHQRKRPIRRGGKTTNHHMIGIMDFNAKR